MVGDEILGYPHVPQDSDKGRSRRLAKVHRADNEAIRIAPRANFLTNRGNAYQAKGDLARAIADYDRAIQLNPAFADAYNNRGAAYRGKGDLNRAIADYQAALRVDPRLEAAAQNLATVQALRKRARK